MSYMMSYAISKYDAVYDVVCAIVYDIVYDISRYDVVCDIVCDVIYYIVYFSAPWFGGVALPDPGRPDVRGADVRGFTRPWASRCSRTDTIHQSCQDPCVDICELNLTT